MKGFPAYRFLLVLVVILVSQAPQEVVPLISKKYMTFYIPEYTRRYIYLEGKFSYSVQLVLAKGDPWTTSSINVTMQAEPIEFIIKAPEYAYYGIMAIVQSLNFRTNPFPSDECRDYIQFFAEGKKGSSAPSPKLCGRLPRGNRDPNPQGLHQPAARTYFTPRGSIKLRVHVDSASSREEYAELNTIGAEIVFTGYTSCPGKEVGGLQTLRPCSSTGESPACIPASLFCDGKIDCGFSPEFGIDEEGCYFPYVYAGVGILLLLLVLVVIYGFIHWVRVKARQAATAGGGARYSQDEGGADPGMCAAVESVDMDSSMAAF